MPTRTEKQFKKRFQILDDSEKILANLTSTQSEIYNEIEKVLDRFATRGYMVYDREAIRMVNELEGTIRRAINKTDYRERVQDYLSNFDKIKQVNEQIQKSVNKLNVAPALTNLQKGAMQQTVNNLLGTGLDVNFIQPVKDAIFQHVVAGASVADTQLALKEIIKGSPEKLGRLDRYVTQISRDALHQYDGLIQQRIAVEFELDAYSYEGSIIKDSRAQCKKWVEDLGGVIRFDQLEKEIDWAYENGSGMIPGTTKDNFAVNRGGYSCRHTCTAIRTL